MYVCVQQAACKELGVNDAEKLVPAIQQLLRHMARNYTVEQVGTADVFKLFICNFTVINYVDVQILGKGRGKTFFFQPQTALRRKEFQLIFTTFILRVTLINACLCTTSMHIKFHNLHSQVACHTSSCAENLFYSCGKCR